jgi:hypothetical protein
MADVESVPILLVAGDDPSQFVDEDHQPERSEAEDHHDETDAAVPYNWVDSTSYKTNNSAGTLFSRDRTFCTLRNLIVAPVQTIDLQTITTWQMWMLYYMLLSQTNQHTQAKCTKKVCGSTCTLVQVLTFLHFRNPVR